MKKRNGTEKCIFFTLHLLAFSERSSSPASLCLVILHTKLFCANQTLNLFSFNLSTSTTFYINILILLLETFDVVYI